MVFTPGARANGVRVPAELYEESRWYACYTRARHEKRVEHVLRERGIESYLPVVSRIQQWKDRKRRVEFPLFPSYVFGRFTLREMHAVLTTPGVSTIVRINGYPTPIPDRELDNIRRFAMAVADSGCEPEPAAFVRKATGSGSWMARFAVSSESWSSGGDVGASSWGSVRSGKDWRSTWMSARWSRWRLRPRKSERWSISGGRAS